jgi:hypothetical protein
MKIDIAFDIDGCVLNVRQFALGEQEKEAVAWA